MALAMAFDEAKTNPHQFKREGDDKHTTAAVLNIPFFSFPDKPELPHATFNQNDPGRFSSIHFHMCDEFHVVVSGKGTIGRHALTPLTVHFARAYTPYGPLVADVDLGLNFFVLRAHRDFGSQRLPEKQDALKAVADRQPSQVIRTVEFPSKRETPAVTMLEAVPEISDGNGLAAYTLCAKPDVEVQAPDPSDGDGQYVIALEGSLIHEKTEHKAPALVFVDPKEKAFRVRSGSLGLKALILNFPRPRSRAIVTGKSASRKRGLKTWRCALCGFVFDEAAGLPNEGIAPGTRWSEVPETWSCPDCSTAKGDFQMVEL